MPRRWLVLMVSIFQMADCRGSHWEVRFCRLGNLFFSRRFKRVEQLSNAGLSTNRIHFVLAALFAMLAAIQTVFPNFTTTNSISKLWGESLDA